MEKIMVGADGMGYQLKDSIRDYLKTKGYDVIDIGTFEKGNPLDYYTVGKMVGKAVSNKEVDYGIAICWTGMGVGIVANKFKGVYAGIVESTFTAERCKVINNCNVLAMGQSVVTPEMAIAMVDLWLGSKLGQGLGVDKNKDYLVAALSEIKKIEEDNFK
jgi:ribose 5-phosphate isomerase B